MQFFNDMVSKTSNECCSLSRNPNKSKQFDNLPNHLFISSKVEVKCHLTSNQPITQSLGSILSESSLPITSSNDVKNRPICILLSQIFEEFIHKYLYKYVESNNLLRDRNSRLHKRYSTNPNLLIRLLKPMTVAVHQVLCF